MDVGRSEDVDLNWSGGKSLLTNEANEAHLVSLLIMQTSSGDFRNAFRACLTDELA